ncbi:hypothetical protein FGB62_64g133 [Gracilaria domingensis]|nr:hypothetical protein FGB62_64g133 [Gracilaria domingensis]
MHRPLQPPPGYERFHSDEAVFPGLAGTRKKKRTLKEFAEVAKTAWRLYLHSYIPDPKMAELEREILGKESRIIRRQAQAVLNRSEANFKRNRQAARDATDRLAQEFHARRPEAEALVKDRVNVLREALSEFAEGYAEGTGGQFSFFKDNEDDDAYPPHIVAEDNKPVIYSSEKL